MFCHVVQRWGENLTDSAEYHKQELLDVYETNKKKEKKKEEKPDYFGDIYLKKVLSTFWWATVIFIGL